MARERNRLTDRAVRSLRNVGYHPDGDGLYLQVTARGARTWVMRYRFGGQRRDMGLGSLQDVTLAEARLARDAVQVKLSKGIDPLAARVRRKPARAAPTPDPRAQTAGAGAEAPAPAPVTLLTCWNEYVEGQEPSWRGRKTRAGWDRSIGKHAAAIKDKPVAEIDVEDVLQVLRPLWMTKAESAGKLRERLERVLDYAKVRKLRTGENPAMWKGNLVHLLPPRPKLQRGHMPALPYEKVPDLMATLAGRTGMSARALEFTILTAARETMTLEATWKEVNGDLWELEASRMKERAFRQPLSSGALAVLAAVRPQRRRPNGLVFPGPTGAVMSNMAMDMLLRELAPGFTPHGMRSSFRDWAGDETDFPREVIEACLAHVVGDETERAYRRGDALRKRREVLEAWSTFCRSKLAGPAQAGDEAREPDGGSQHGPESGFGPVAARGAFASKRASSP